jgi:hypothetical protein
MNIETVPSPDGAHWQHTLEGKAEAEPASQFTDSLNDLERLQAGDSYPMVTSWQEGDSRWTVEVSLWSQNKTPSDEESASLNGTLAEVIASTKMQ